MSSTTEETTATFAAADSIRPVKESQTLLINQQSQILSAEGKQVIKFGFGQSPFPPLARATEALKKHAGCKDYTDVQGLKELRSAVAAFHADYNSHTPGDGGASVPPDLRLEASDVFIGPGSKQLIFTVMKCFADGELDVLIPSPAWVSYGPQAALCGHREIRVPSTIEDRWRVTPAALEAAFRAADEPKQKQNQKGEDAAAKVTTLKSRPRMLILTYPGNPDGLSYTDAELTALAKVIREAGGPGAFVVSDEIYALLAHEPTTMAHHRDDKEDAPSVASVVAPHKSIAAHLPERTIVTTGLSKWCGAGGWRLGAALFPKATTPLRKAFVGVASETYSCAPAPVQWAAVEAYAVVAAGPASSGSSVLPPDTARYLAIQRKFLRQVGCAVAARLNSKDVRTVEPTGAFYVYPDFSRYAAKFLARYPPPEDTAAKSKPTATTLSERFFATLLKETHVALLAGPCFGAHPDTLVARLAYVSFDGAKVLAEAPEALPPPGEGFSEEFVAAHAKTVFEGIDRIVEFLDKL